jgi:imidazolonepropionase
MPAPEVLITNIKGLVQVRETTPGFLASKALGELPIITNSFLLLRDGLIHDYGKMDHLPENYRRAEIVDASGRFVFPSFVDSHTHLVFAAGREDEFVMKIKGATYEEIAARGGGILNSAKKLQAMSEEELFLNSLGRMQEIMRCGTGAVEIKSGYGLTVKDEVKMLRVARRLGQACAMTVRTTFLGAHTVPAGTTKEAYLELLSDEMIPAIAEEKLADYIDVFCEQGFFTVDETIRIVERGKKFGMKPRLHANQLHRSGGVQAGIRTGALSVDHLENIGDEEIAALKDTATMPTALPGAAFFLNLPFPPARKMIDAGLPLALATDYNPGSAPSGNMSLILALACIRMKLTPEEAINAATINTAYALELLNTHGSITRGKTANVFITKPMSSVAFLPYSFGSQLIEQVFLNGVRIDEASGQPRRKT